MRRATEFFRRLFRRPIKKEAGIMKRSVAHAITCSTPQATEHSVAQHNAVQHSEPVKPRTITQQETVNVSWPRRAVVVKRAGSQAGRQDVGRFMKHGKQLPHYRKSVKAKVQPGEEED